ncbi:MAG: exosortase [Paraglaciecola sp.]|uniref:exosortase n=1 Tax=Paraglaciecola sp. TaxID=1920173 RepID=UPI00329919D1
MIKPEFRTLNYAALLLLHIMAAVFFIPFFMNLAVEGVWANPVHSHGPLVLIISLFLVFQKRQAIASLPSVRVHAGLGILFFSLSFLLFVVGGFTDMIHFKILSFIAIFCGTYTYIFGLKVIKVLLFPIFFMFFMIPIPGVILDPLSSFLKLLVSDFAVEILYQLGYPVAQNGIIILVGSYKLFVADACSGMRTLLMLETLGILYLYLLKHHSLIRNIGLAACIIPISIFANILRVISLILVTFYFGDEAGQGFMHDFASLALFIFGFFLMVSVDSLLRLAIKVSKKRQKHT